MSNGHIFISYRRDDSAGYTRAIYDQLAERFTQERIFMDVDAIEPGLPFDQVINQAVSRCEVLIAMIGKRWMEQQPGVGPRLNDEKDFVRLEIAAALTRNVRVIPVLLDGASMPTEEVLPEPLRPLARRNAIEISNSRFNSDVDRLVEAVSKVLGESPAPPSQERFRSHRTTRYWLLGGLTAVALFSSVAYFYWPRFQADLCKALEGKSIRMTVNAYDGVVGPNGINVIAKENGTFEFQTEGQFEYQEKLTQDATHGVCEGSSITIYRTLNNGTIQTLAGSIFKAGTGRIEMGGNFRENEKQYKWTGRIDTPSQ